MSHSITRHYIDVQGRRVHYRRCGEGPPVVMLHESPRSGTALLALMALGPVNVTMLAFDTPGCGDSEPLNNPDAEIADYADAFARTLTALGIERAVVYGTHTGAAMSTRTGAATSPGRAQTRSTAVPAPLKMMRP